MKKTFSGFNEIKIILKENTFPPENSLQVHEHMPIQSLKKQHTVNIILFKISSIFWRSCAVKKHRNFGKLSDVTCFKHIIELKCKNYICRIISKNFHTIKIHRIVSKSFTCYTVIQSTRMVLKRFLLMFLKLFFCMYEYYMSFNKK